MAQPTLTPREFAQKWGDNATKERAASQEHFIDLCRMLGEPTPNEADLDSIEIRTNFTNLSPKLYTVTLDDLAADDPSVSQPGKKRGECGGPS